MSKTVYRKCPNCGHVNLNSDYCTECNTLVNVNLRRKIEQKERKQKKEKDISDKPNAVTQFFEKILVHPNILVRVLARIFYSVWAVVIMIGTFLAFVFSYVAA